MITKERLEELIKQGATIYTILQGSIEELDLTFIEILGQDNNCLVFNAWSNTFEKYFYQDNEMCFETEEDARWELETTATRTETLKFPKWEEFITRDKTITFYKNQVKYQMYIFVKNKNTNNCRIIIYADDNSQDWFVFEKSLTKENYIEACKLCRKLFLGEEE